MLPQIEITQKAQVLADKMNNNKYLLGISMLMLNIGSKYLIAELSETQEEMLKSKLVRRITLFSLFFMATRDIWASLGLLAAFLVITSDLFNTPRKNSSGKDKTEQS